MSLSVRAPAGRARRPAVGVREPWSIPGIDFGWYRAIRPRPYHNGVGTLTRPEYRWLLPAALTADPVAVRPARRSTRDWIVDTICFVLALGFAVVVTGDLLEGNPEIVPGFAGTPDWLLVADFAFGVLAATALWWRRRWPVHLLLAVLVFGVFAVTTAVSIFILLFTVAVHRRFAVAAPLAVAVPGANAVFALLRPEQGTSFWESMAWTTAFAAIVLLWGMVIRARRQLVVSLRDRAERAEAEQQLRVSQARALERTRIAREMHDVLAHRISLLSLHAGALEIRPDAAPAEVAGAAGVIRASAHRALQDLREVIGVLREDTDAGAAPERPQPTLDGLAALADESRAAGTTVTLDIQVDQAAVPDGTGRTAYRIVQEGLTNARKHAPGTAVGVAVTGGAGDGLTVEVRNRWPIGRGGAAAIPGAGTGLVGLAERATLAGGRLAHGRSDADEFLLSAWLPWPA
jgi:signal transduction histidine kinase